MTTQAQFFKALGDARRLRIVGALLEGELDAGQLAAVAARDSSTVSRHLRVLVEAGILQRRRDGRRIIYTIVSPEMTATHKAWPVMASDALRSASRLRW